MDANEAYTTFTGVTRLQRGQTPSGALIDRPVSEPSKPESTLTRSEQYHLPAMIRLTRNQLEHLNVPRLLSMLHPVLESVLLELNPMPAEALEACRGV